MMLGLGLGNKKPAATPPAPPAGGFIFDVTANDFEARVLQASMAVPILVDFWAPWCGPCKQLMPVLEAAVSAAGGKILLAKVNIDENPQLAQALRVQSVPTVYAFFQGQPVTAFNGVRPASEVKMLVDQLVRLAQQGKPDAVDIPAALKQAAELLAVGDAAGAQGLYAHIITQDESNAAAFAGLVRTYIALDDLKQARALIDNAPEAITKDPHFPAARTALEVAEAAPGKGALTKMTAAVQKNPADHQARYDLALAQFAAGEKEEAINSLLEIIRVNRAWEEDKARIQLVKFFDALGPVDPLTVAGRRKLSSVLFS